MKLHIAGPVYGLAGYTTVTREITLALHRQGVEIFLQPIAWFTPPFNLPGHTRKILEGLMLRKGECEYLLNIGIPPLFLYEEGYKKSIGLTMLEIDGVPEQWVDLCNKMDEVWVPSTFNRDTFIKSGIQKEKVTVLPLGVDTTVFNPRDAKGKGNRKDFTFLTVCEWIPRKGYDILLEAYLKEFTGNDAVKLVIKSHVRRNYDSGEKIKQEIKHFMNNTGVKNPPKINLISQILNTSEMANLYKSADCFVLPTRGEGWNFPVLEAMASGVPVITTDWSAHLDFVSEKNAFLIKVKELEPVPRLGLPIDKFYMGFRWAKPDISHLRKLMRRVYENKAEALKKADNALESIKNLTWDVTAERIMNRLLNEGYS
ncbi:MAG: hypothetical protein PWP31_406 [Clostridia bacterium]|nr:hypothetical protein [Clostridia bacterium]